MKELVNYAAVFGLVAVSGMPFFFKSALNSVFLCMFVLFVFLKRSIPFNPKHLAIVAVFFFVEVLQDIFIYDIAIATFIGSYTRFFLAILTVTICDRKFTRYYVNIIYVLTLIGFVFYVPSVLSNNVRGFFESSICPFFPPLGLGTEDNPFYDHQPTVMIYTFHPVLKEFRNSGPFWEPGAYGVFLLFAIIFNVIRTGTLINKKNIVFAIAVITTISTTGYAALFVIVTSFYLVKGTISNRLFMVSMLVPVSILMFVSFDFLGQKVEKNMELKDDPSSRFGSAYADVQDWATSPFIGWGKGEMRFGGREFTFFSDDQHRNNGLSDLLATYGIFAFITLLVNYFRTLKTMCLSHSFPQGFAPLAFAVILLLGFSQSLFQYPFFLSIMFMHIIYKDRLGRLGMTPVEVE